MLTRGYRIRNVAVRSPSLTARPTEFTPALAGPDHQGLLPSLITTWLFNNTGQGFPGGAVVKNPPANAGHTGSSPGPGRSHMPRSN